MRYYSGVSVPGADTLIQYINNTEIRANRPGVISIAEDQAFGQGFHAEWDRGFGDNLIDQVTKVNDGDRDMNLLWYGGGGKSGIGGSGFFRVVYTESHDLTGALNGPGAKRLPARIDSGDPDSYHARKRSMLAAAVVLTMPGTPMLFMGQEMLEDEQFADTNPLDWTHTITYAGMVEFYRDMVHLRRNLDGASLGLTGPKVTLQHLNNNAKVLAYHRWGAGANDQVMVIMNWSANTWNSYNLSFPENGAWYVNLNSDWTAYGSDFGNVDSPVVQVAGNTGTVALGPYSVLILSRQAHPRLDSDNDGLLNGWEQEHFGDPLIAVATDDDDHDGADNWNEQSADTDPRDGGSVLTFINIGRTGSSVDLEWTGGQNARQVIQQAASVTGSWNNLFTNPPPTPVTNSLSLSNAAASGFYRIRIEN
jgi:1,4-alpha-glucan branching enzyme